MTIAMAMMFALTACGNKVEDTNNDVNDENIETSVTEESTVGENTLETEEDVDEAIDANEGEIKIEPIYEEGTDVVLITNAEAWGDEYYDGEQIDMNALTPAGGKGTIGEEISIYNLVKQNIGCLKVGATVEVVTKSDEWSYVSVYDGCYVVRTDEFDKAMVATTVDITTSENESASEKNEEENTNETTTNNGGNSNNGGESNNSSESNNNTATSNSSTNGSTSTSEPTPTTPTVNYSASDVVAIFESTLRGAGFVKPEDYMTAEEMAMFGPTDGMGWGDMTATLETAPTKAASLVEYMNSSGYTTFYIEVVEMSDGVVTLRCYTG